MRALSQKVLRELREFVDHAGDGDIDTVISDAPRLLKAIDFALTPKRSAKPARVRREAKKKTKREETAEIRQAVFARNNGWCEACGLTLAMDLEHAFGRARVPQSVSSCLAVCRACHRERTDGVPSAEYWLEVYAKHFRKHGYDAEEQRTLARLESLRLQGLGGGTP